MLRYVDVTLRYVVLRYVMLCYVMLCYVMLCYIILCYVMLCYVMLCYVMLCYVMLCYGLLLTCEKPYMPSNGPFSCIQVHTSLLWCYRGDAGRVHRVSRLSRV
jgi:hypothetical protein